MAEYTENLGLLKKDPVADAKDTFNIQTMLNENWDRVDAAVGSVCKIATGSYKGTGTSGANNPNSLTFDFDVKFVAIQGSSGSFLCHVVGNPTGCVVLATVGSATMTYSNKTLTWYGANAVTQLNEAAIDYRYVAFG